MEKEIGKINKNDTTDIVVRIDDFGGVTGLTIREFVTSDRYTGFTKSGVRIGAKDFADFKKMINSIEEKDLEQAEDSESKEESQENSKESNSESEEKKEEMPDY